MYSSWGYIAHSQNLNGEKSNGAIAELVRLVPILR